MNPILYLLFLGLATAINPIQIVAVIIVICSHEGRRKGIFYTLAWVFGFFILGLIAFYVVIGKNVAGPEAPSSFRAGFKIVMGVIFIVLAIWEYIRNPQSTKAYSFPSVFGVIDKITVLKAVAIGFFLSISNFRALLFSIIAMDHILISWQGNQSRILAYNFFALIASLGVVMPVFIYIITGKKAVDMLNRVKSWMISHTKIIVIAILFLFGVFLVGEGLYSLWSGSPPII